MCVTRICVVGYIGCCGVHSVHMIASPMFLLDWSSPTSLKMFIGHLDRNPAPEQSSVYTGVVRCWRPASSSSPACVPAMCAASCVAVAAVALLIFTAVERWYQHQSLENRNDGNGLALRENIKLKGLLYSLLWTVVHFCILLIDIFTCKASEFFTPNTNSQNVHL